MPARMGRARLVLREKVMDEEGNITEVAIWAVPGRRSGPERIRYRLAFVRPGEQIPAVLYDNHHPKDITDTSKGPRSPTSLSMSIDSSRTSPTMFEGSRETRDGQDADDQDQAHPGCFGELPSHVPRARGHRSKGSSNPSQG